MTENEPKLNKKVYTALTVGPIYKTLQNVKSTKAIWGASYMFSYIIKQIVNNIKGVDFLMPYIDNIVVEGKSINPFTVQSGTGLFPDRIIFTGDYDYRSLVRLCELEVKDFANKMWKNLDKESSKKLLISDNQEAKKNEIGIYNESNKDELESYFTQYLNLYTLQIEIEEKDVYNDNENPIIQVNNLLDSLELQQKVIQEEKKDYLYDFFENVYYNFLVDLELKKQNKTKFPSTIEIATAEFIEKKDYNNFLKILKSDDDESQQKFVEAIRENFPDKFRNCQKYIAIVQADGDNMGHFIKYIYGLKDGESLFKHFSKQLLTFAYSAVELVKSYGGTTIYAGGDDLLYFCPIAITNNEPDSRIQKNVFSLIKQIDECFENTILLDEKLKPHIDSSNLIKKPSMSYGISISYYKFPLNQALEEGVNQLFSVAKKTDNKNAVSYSVLKHSGQKFGTTYCKSEVSYENFEKLITSQIDGDNFIHSIAYKMKDQQATIGSIGDEPDNIKRSQLFNNFFKNNFNEPVHLKKDGELVDFLIEVKELFKNIYNENPVFKLVGDKKEIEHQKNLKKIYSSLRFIDFIINKNEY